MSNSIDPDSIHLGGTDAQYYAAYYPSTPPQPGTPCALPPELVWEPHNRPLLPLDQACLFTFPDITPLPPIYNPPVFNFEACEALTTDVRFTVSKPLKGSTLTLTTKGPEKGASGMAECGFILTQDLHLPDVCESFKAESNINFGKNLKNSDLKLVVKDTPDCGFTLQGNFDLNNVCETADIVVDIAFAGAAKNSYVTSSPTTPEGCDNTIAGVVNVEACETFTATSDVTFGKKLSASSLTLTSSSIPDCGFELNGNIELGAVCETANISSNIEFLGAAKNSVLKFTPLPSGPDGLNCDTELTGVITVDACETFEASMNVTFVGDKLKRSYMQLQPTATPNCGFSLDGEIYLEDVCESANITSNITFLGAAKKSELSFKPADPGPEGMNCDSELIGTINVEACETFEASVNVTFGRKLQTSTLSFTPQSIPDCGFELTGNIDVDEVCETANVTTNIRFLNATRNSTLEVRPAGNNPLNCDTEIFGDIDVVACETFETNYNINIVGPVVKRNEWRLDSTSTPDCSVTLNGDVEIEACADFYADGTINFTGNAVKSQNIILTAASQPNCGITLTGDVEISACADVKFDVQTVGTGMLRILAPPTALEPRRVLAEMSSGLSLEINQKDECSSTIIFKQEDREFTFESEELEIDESELEVVSGKDYRREQHSLRLKKENKKLSLAGAGCCATDFTCSGGDGGLLKDSIVLGHLKIKYEEWAAPECCEQVCGHHYMDWCPGIGEWKTWYLKTIEPSPCCAGGSKIDMCAGEIVMSSSSSSSSSSTSTMSSSSISVSSSSSSSTSTMSSSSISVTSSSGGTTTLTGASLSLGGGECSSGQKAVLEVDIITPSPCCQTPGSIINLCEGVTHMADAEGNSVSVSPSGVTVKNAAGKSVTLTPEGLADPVGDDCSTSAVLKKDRIEKSDCCDSLTFLDLCQGELYLEKDGATTDIVAGAEISIAAASGNTVVINTDGIMISDPEGANIGLSSSGLSISGPCNGNIVMSAHTLNTPECCETGSSFLDLCGGTLHLEKDDAITDMVAGGAMSITSESGNIITIDPAGITITSPEGTSVEFSSGGMSVSSGDCGDEGVSLNLDRLQSTHCKDGRNYMDFDTGWIHLEDAEGNNSDIIAGTSITLSPVDGGSVDIRCAGINIDDTDGSSLNLVPGNSLYSKDASGAYVDIIPGDSITIEASTGANATLGADGLYINNAAGDAVNMYIITGKTATWHEMTFCVDGVDKKAWVLMTDPE